MPVWKVTVKKEQQFLIEAVTRQEAEEAARYDSWEIPELLSYVEMDIRAFRDPIQDMPEFRVKDGELVPCE